MRMPDEMRGLYGCGTTLSVLVSSYNQLANLQLAFGSYTSQRECLFEVVIADDGSDDGTLEWLAGGGFGFGVRWTKRKHDGYGLVLAWNEAARMATGDRLLFTNADVVHGPKSFSSHTDCGEAVGAGLVLGVGERAWERLEKDGFRDRLDDLRREFPSYRSNADFASSVEPNRNTVGIWSSNLSVNKDAFLEAGGFDEGYAGKWGCEDYDLLDRLQDRGGLVVWVKGSVAYHFDHPEADYAIKREGCGRYERQGGRNGAGMAQDCTERAKLGSQSSGASG